MSYIDKQKLLLEIDRVRFINDDIDKIVSAVEDFPESNVEPVQPPAYWEGHGICQCCSYCGVPIPTMAVNGEELYDNDSHYCYNCGHKMVESRKGQ